MTMTNTNNPAPCATCDGSGTVHRADGEYMGECPCGGDAPPAPVVAADEHEQGERALLNLGHTFGHAIENAMGYGVWLHGEAVATGTVMAADLSQRMGWLNEAQIARIKTIMQAAKLPIEAPDLGVEEYLRLMQLDKKVSDGRIRLILQQDIGKAIITADYDADKLKQTLSLAA